MEAKMKTPSPLEMAAKNCIAWDNKRFKNAAEWENKRTRDSYLSASRYIIRAFLDAQNLGEIAFILGNNYAEQKEVGHVISFRDMATALLDKLKSQLEE